MQKIILTSLSKGKGPLRLHSLGQKEIFIEDSGSHSLSSEEFKPYSKVAEYWKTIGLLNIAIEDGANKHSKVAPAVAKKEEEVALPVAPLEVKEVEKKEEEVSEKKEDKSKK